MKGLLIVSDNCQPCAGMKNDYAAQIQSGEIELVSLEEDPGMVQKLMNDHGVGLPGLVIMANNGDVIAIS